MPEMICTMLYTSRFNFYKLDLVNIKYQVPIIRSLMLRQNLSNVVCWFVFFPEHLVIQKLQQEGLELTTYSGILLLSIHSATKSIAKQVNTSYVSIKLLH